MRFMAIWTYEPEQRDPIMQKRMETGRLAPEGVKFTSEWYDVTGGRSIALFESDNEMAMVQCLQNWTNMCKFDVFPVIEVLDDKGTKFA